MHSDQAKQPAQAEMPREATRPLFQESEFHYDRNRRQAKQSRIAPAIIASGGPGVHIKLGPAFTYLTNAEARRIIRRIEEAISISEQETK